MTVRSSTDGLRSIRSWTPSQEEHSIFKSLSSALLWRGLLAVAIGVVSVTWPGITVGALVIVFAAYAFLAAFADGARAFSSDRPGRCPATCCWPCSRRPPASPRWSGRASPRSSSLSGSLHGRLSPGPSRSRWRSGAANRLANAPRALTGVLSVALGVVLAIRPDIGALTLATAFGLFSIVYGLSTITLGAQVRRAGKTARG